MPRAGAASGRLRPLFERAGARWVDLPVLYPADPFLETAGEDIRRRMFVTEGPQGERLALRPDFTIPLCLEHLASGAEPERYAYEGLVFRRHDTGAPERLETGYEDLGRADKVRADAEALALALAGLADVLPGPAEVRLGDIGLFVALLAALGLPEPWRRRLRRSFGVPHLMEANLARLSAPRGGSARRLDPQLADAADSGDERRLLALMEARFAEHGHQDGAGRAPAEIVGRFLDQRALAETHIDAPAMQALARFLALDVDLPQAPAALRGFCSEAGLDLGDALALFERRAAEIATLVPDAVIRFQAGFGRPLDYYSGLVFEIRAAGTAVPLVGGGRYDRLMEMLGAGRPVPAVGFTMRLDLAEVSA